MADENSVYLSCVRRALALLLGLSASLGVPADAHTPSPQECLEGGDFIAHAAESRDHGMARAEFLDKLVADIYLIQAFPPSLRWFVVDPDDAEFLRDESARVFDAPLPPEAHRGQFLARCFER
jgi:hypothetical protein